MAQNLQGLRDFQTEHEKEMEKCYGTDAYYPRLAGGYQGIINASFRLLEQYEARIARLEAEAAEGNTALYDLETLSDTLMRQHYCQLTDHVPGKLGRCIVCDAELTEVEEAEPETAGVTR